MELNERRKYKKKNLHYWVIQKQKKEAEEGGTPVTPVSQEKGKSIKKFLSKSNFAFKKVKLNRRK